MTAGVWMMTDDGEFVLREPYKTVLFEARLAATHGWREALYAYLEPKTRYTRDELNAELLRRVREGLEPNEAFEEFVLEALDGDLMKRKTS